MARKPQVQNDKLRRKCFSATENTQRFLKFKSKNIHFSVQERSKAKAKLARIDSKGFLVRVKNRCIITGKSRGIMRKFSISQTSIRVLARAGCIAGMKKASWLVGFCGENW